ncbi:MAG: hypothetical protein H6895_05960 [Defluviimonas sp.]|uniref:hypothetical protein n=1 Tax=Albidovulum sp. TaxID=1872424 RepID=UPI002A27B5EF|nr:hypothetical protein [Defluviimonas sp.]
MDDLDEDDLRKFPPWIDRAEFLRDVAAVLAKYEITVGHFYDALGVDVYSENDEARRTVINQLADLRRELTLRKRGG